MKKPVYSLYRITCLPNGKIYFGQTVKLVSTRWSEHKSSAWSRKSGCRALYAAIRKYGAEQFNVETVATFDSRAGVDEAEYFFIKKYRTRTTEGGYNISEGGGAKNLSAETKALISMRAQGRRPSAETRARMSRSQAARPPMSVETRKKLSLALTGRQISDAAREAMSASGKARIRSAAEIARGREWGLSHRGRPRSAETIQKIREGALARWALRKAARQEAAYG